MKKHRTRIFFLLLILVDLGMLILCAVMFAKGFSRGEVIEGPFQPSFLAAWGLPICIGTWGVLLTLTCVSCAMELNGETTKSKLALALCSISALGLVAFSGIALRAHFETYLKSQRVPYFSTISLAALSDLKNQNFIGAVYIEREGCVLCDRARPKIESYLEKKDKIMLCYRTDQDRSTDYQNMMKVLEEYNVESVPAIIVITGQDEVNTYFFDEIISGVVFGNIDIRR